MKKETDSASKDRLAKIEKDLGSMKEEFNQMNAHWQNEKEIIQKSVTSNEKIEQLDIAEQKAEREGNLEKVGRTSIRQTDRT